MAFRSDSHNISSMWCSHWFAVGPQVGPPPPYDGLGPAVTEAEEPVATEAVPTGSKLCPIQGTKILALRLSMVILGYFRFSWARATGHRQGIRAHHLSWNVLSHKRSTLVTLVSGFDARLKPTSPDHMIKRYKTIPLCSACVIKHCFIAATLFDGVWVRNTVPDFFQKSPLSQVYPDGLFGLTVCIGYITFTYFYKEFLGPSGSVMSCL